MKIIQCEQGSQAWHEAKIGIPSASHFRDILANGKGESRRKYMTRLAAERIGGVPIPTYSNGHMRDGKLAEPKAREYYEFVYRTKVKQVGFILCEKRGVGCSPDGLVGKRGALEIKKKSPHLMMDFIDKGGVPSEWVPQLQGIMMITGRAWIDLEVWCEGFTPPIIRVKRDQRYIDMLEKALAQFGSELHVMVKRIEEQRS